MDVARPFSAVSPTLEGEVLVVLAGTTQPLSGARVAQLVRRGGERGVTKALDRLVEQGLVLREQAGRAYLHTLNREHVAAPVAELLASLRTEFLRRLRNEFTTWRQPPLHASVFGSAARADGDSSSDIDLCIVRPAGVDDEESEWRLQVERLSERVHGWSGNHASIVELAESELDELRVRQPRVLADVRADGIDLAGVSIQSLFREST
jgi:predicted nucleotidyltransferase